VIGPLSLDITDWVNKFSSLIENSALKTQTWTTARNSVRQFYVSLLAKRLTDLLQKQLCSVTS
jgi:hypothetical protein